GTGRFIMKTRAITGVFFVAVMLAAVLTGPYTFSVFFLLLSLVAVNEFYRMLKGVEGVNPNRIPGTLLGAVLLALVILYASGNISVIWFVAAIPLVSVIFLLELYRHATQPFHNIA